MKSKLADHADSFTVVIYDEAGKLCLSMRFDTTELRDVASDALQKMLDRATEVKRL